MDEMQLLIDMHIDNDRQGPGSDEMTHLAITLSGLRGAKNLKIADIGCGSGASTMVLAKELDAKITAVDFLPDFLAKLEQNAQKAGVSDRITAQAQSMDALTFQAGELDAIWSEGAIYNMGFEAGIQAWKPFLKDGGILAVSELTWLTDERPDDLQAHWDAEYPQVDTASAKIAILEKHGFSPIGYFTLPEYCWMENYYNPIKARLDSFAQKHGNTEMAKAIVEGEKAEMALYEQYKAYVSYGYYVAKKVR
jgi:cyclopropane fatty-acyl-phospholipid synthase-like methyltransferase